MIGHKLAATPNSVCLSGRTSQFYAGRPVVSGASAGPRTSCSRSRLLGTRIQAKVGLWGRIVSFVRRRPPTTVEDETTEVPQMEWENASLVFGASGKIGSRVVQELLKSGETVVAAVRSAESLKSALKDLGDVRDDMLIIKEGIDIVDPSKLEDELFKGVSNVIVCTGSSQRLEDAKEIYSLGVKNIIDAVKRSIPAVEPKTSQILSMSTPKDLEKWERLDDVIMGGQSESKISLVEGGGGMVFTGKVITEGGGFGAQRTVSLDINDLSDYDGIAIRVKGDGQIYKMNIKTSPQEDVPESTYQAAFETLENEWKDVEIPWHEFLPVKRSMYEPSEPPMDLSTVRRFALVSSKFSFNGLANPKFKAGDFSLEVQGGISAFKSERPVVTLLSTGGVERNAIIGEDSEKRQKEIPIIMLNPGGVLNYAYDGEIALRESGLPYAIVRSTGFKDIAEESLLEGGQGDSFIGLMSYTDVTRTIIAASKSPDATYKTFEARRRTTQEAVGKKMEPADFQKLFLKLVVDWRRASIGIPPFPASVPPPTPPTEEQKKKMMEKVEAIQSAAAAEART